MACAAATQAPSDAPASAATGGRSCRGVRWHAAEKQDHRYLRDRCDRENCDASANIGISRSPKRERGERPCRRQQVRERQDQHDARHPRQRHQRPQRIDVEPQIRTPTLWPWTPAALASTEEMLTEKESRPTRVEGAAGTCPRECKGKRRLAGRLPPPPFACRAEPDWGGGQHLRRLDAPDQADQRSARSTHQPGSTSPSRSPSRAELGKAWWLLCQASPMVMRPQYGTL